MYEFEKIVSESSANVARRLLGAYIIRTPETGRRQVVRIVETESYHSKDPASHSYGAVTKRSAIMFGPAGRAYVYFIYGAHYCLNIVTGPVGDGSAVLIRSAEPVEGVDERPLNLLNGPGKLCRALDIDLRLNSHDLRQKPLEVIFQPELGSSEILSGPRIGISKAKDVVARFYIRDNPFVSKYKK